MKIVCGGGPTNPALVILIRAKDINNRRVDWLTFSNINTWTDAAKTELIKVYGS